MSQRTELINDRLRVLNPESVEIEDQSHLHAGHAGAKSGKGHFAVTVVSEQFAGERTLNRHRMVHRALGELMETDIHALTITTLTPGEYHRE